MGSGDFQRRFSGMNRRDFLFGSAAAAAAFGTSRLALAKDAATLAKLNRISLMTNDFDGTLPEIWDRSKPVAPEKLDMMDLPDAVADRLHLHNLEVCNINLLSMDPSYIGEFKKRLHKAKSRVVDLVVELDPPATAYRGYVSVCSPHHEIRVHAIEETKKWIDIAAVLGSPSIMPDQGVHYLPEDLTPCIEGLKALVNYGKPKGVAVILATSISRTWCPAAPSPRVPTRAGPAVTGRSAAAARSTRTSPGPTTSPPGSCCPSAG